MRPPSTKVMEIFSEALASHAARRQEYLDRACEGDAELRAEVESLLATQHRLNRFLDQPTVDEGHVAVVESGAGDFDANAMETGRTQVGRYAVLERIGEGGFGVVYAARQNHPIQRDVALKIVRLGMDSRQIIGRFESERQALALMDHPNIARIFDAGATADGRPYFAMELVRGPPITEYCDAKTLPIARRLELFVTVCQAVQHAHQKGIIHRDLKPSNILVAEVDGAAVPKVIDFGIAKAMEALPGEQTVYSDARPFIGTPQYMSPEQAGAGDGDVDTRSDIYSLGVLLYELLTGFTPFDAETLADAPFEEVTRIIREKDPPKPSARLCSDRKTLDSVAGRRGLDAQRLCRVVAGELDWVVARALEKDRCRRYETASALADDVRHYLALEPLLAGPPDTLYRVRKFARRHRKSLAAAGAVGVALLLGLAGTTYGLVRAKRDRSRAETALAEAKQVSRFLTEMLRSADPDVSKGSQTLRDLLDRTGHNLDAGALRDQPLVEAEIRTTIGAAYLSLSLSAESHAQIGKALSIRRSVLGDMDRRTAQSISAFGQAKWLAGDVEGAELLLREALSTQEKVLGEQDEDTIRTLERLGGVLVAKGGRLPDTEAVLRRAVDLARRRPVSTDLKARVMLRLGDFLCETTDWEEGESLVRAGIDIQRRTDGEKSRSMAVNLTRLAWIKLRHGDVAGARADCLSALGIQHEILPADHYDMNQTLRMLGLISRQEGKLEEAAKWYGEALDRHTRVAGPTGLAVARIKEEMAEVLRLQGRRNDAIALRRQAAEMRSAWHTNELTKYPGAGYHRGTVGELHVRRGEFAEADRDLAEACRLQPRDPRWWFIRASLQNYTGDRDGCRETCRQILQHFGGTTGGQEALAARASLLSDETPTPSDLARLAGMVGRAGADRIRPPTESLDFCNGLVELRGGRFQRAVELLTRSRERAALGPSSVATGFYLAIALHRAGRAAESAPVLAAATAEYEQLPRVEDGDVGLEVDDWLICQIARREAEALHGSAR